MTGTEVRLKNERALIATARAGDLHAYAHLYRSHWPAAVDGAVRLGRSRADAEDLAARAFERIRTALLNGHGPTDSFRGYLMMAVRSVHLDELSRSESRRTSPTDDPAMLDGRVEPFEPVALSDEMAEALAALSLDQRTVLMMRYGEGCSIAEMRDALGSPSDNAVSAVIGRAREKLRLAYSRRASDGSASVDHGAIR